MTRLYPLLSSLAPFKKSLGAVSHALLACSLLASCQTVDRKDGSKAASDSTASLFDDEVDPVPAPGAVGSSGVTPKPPSGMRVVSLKALDRVLATCPAHPCGDSLFIKLGGITSLAGVVFDERAGDALLYGEAREGEPALYVEDLVVALRNAWLAYVQQKGSRITYLHPGLSLEPSAAVLKDMQKIAQDIAKIDAAGSEKALERWRETCRKPYKVAVTGLPEDSRLTGALLRADYAMKALANGAENLGLHGFPGMAELRKIRFQGEMGQTEKPVPPKPSLTRYWFHPGNQEWEMGEGIVVLKRCPIMLMTEEMFDRLRASDTTSAEPSDDLAEAFAFGFTRLYGKAAEVKPVFRELEGIFRLVAAAKLVRDRFPESEARSAFPALFQGYRLESAGVDKQLPGIADLQHFDHARNTPMGMEIERLWLPSCGGVSVAIEPSKAWVRRLRDPRLNAFRKAVLSSRPSESDWQWEVAGSQEYWTRLRERLRLQDMGQRFPNLAFFRLRRGGEDRKMLELVDEDDHVLKAGAAKDVLGEIALRADARKVASAFIEMDNWPAGEAAAFRDTAATFVKQKKSAWVPVPVVNRPGWLSTGNALFNSSSDWEQGEPPMDPVAAGPMKGWQRVTFRFLTSSGGKTVPTALHVMVKSEAVALRLQEEAARDFRTKLFIAYSPLSALLSIITEFRASLPEKEKKDVRIFEDEEGSNELG